MLDSIEEAVGGKDLHANPSVIAKEICR